jgi:hypothetical protein
VRIGLLAFQGSMNYGGVLQVYALQQTVKSMGHDCPIINYIPDMHDFKKHPLQYVLRRKNSLEKALFGLSNYDDFKTRQQLFSKFRSERLVLSPQQPVGYANLAQEAFKYDVVCVGSDQLWNLNQPDSANRAYMLDFDRSNRSITYAVSFGDGIRQKPEETIAAIPLMKRFSSISVREQEGLDFLHAHGIDAELALDSTLVADKNVWGPFLGKAPIVEGKYILVYGFANANQSYGDLIDVSKRASHELGLPVICPVMTPTMGRAGFTNKFACGPEEFLNLVEHASLVITSSFHGCVFSYLLNRPFAAVYGDGRPEPRKDTLLALLGEEERKLSPIQNPDYDRYLHCNFEYADKRIASSRESSLRFLKNAIEG